MDQAMTSPRLSTVAIERALDAAERWSLLDRSHDRIFQPELERRLAILAEARAALAAQPQPVVVDRTTSPPTVRGFTDEEWATLEASKAPEHLSQYDHECEEPAQPQREVERRTEWLIETTSPRGKVHRYSDRFENPEDADARAEIARTQLAEWPVRILRRDTVEVIVRELEPPQ